MRLLWWFSLRWMPRCSALPTWPFAAVAWLGDVSAVMLIAIRTFRLIFHPADVADVHEAVE